MTNFGLDGLRENKRLAAVVVAGFLMAALASGLVLMAGPAGAEPCLDCPPGGGDGDANSPPTIGPVNGSVAAAEGQQATYTGTFSDPDGDPVTISVSSGPGSVQQSPAGGSDGTWLWSFNTTDGPDQSQTVTMTASDGTETATTTFSLTVNNVAPTVTPPNNSNDAREYPYMYPYDFSVGDPGNDTWDIRATGCGSNGRHVQPSSASSGWGTITVWCEFLDGPGSSTVSASAVDSDGAASNTASKTISVQNENPTAALNAPSSVNEGAPATVGFTDQRDGVTDTNAGFRYAVDCNGGPLDGSTYANSGTTNSTTCAYDDNKPRLDKGGFGSYTVRAKIIDKDGGSSEYTATVTLNNVNPKGTIQINNGAATANNAAVNLTLSANDPPPGSNVGQMRFRNENTQTWSVWEPYGTSRQWQLSDGDGGKTVFVEYRDNAGNVSQGTISDGIQLDTTTPADATAPTVVSKPSPSGKRVAPTARPTVAFSEKMDEASVEARGVNGLPTTFTLKKGATVLPASVAYTETATGQYKAVLTPSRRLRSGVTYTATVTTDAKDAAGNALAAPKTWRFTVR